MTAQDLDRIVWENAAKTIGLKANDRMRQKTSDMVWNEINRQNVEDRIQGVAHERAKQ